MQDVIRVVLVGCGSIARHKAQRALARGDIEFVGFVDLAEDAARSLAAKFELDNVPTGTDLQAMLAEVKPDAVLDCTVPGAHADVTIAALEAGCHVLGEKPMAVTMDDARRMVQAAADTGRIYMVVQNQRYNEGIRALRSFLDSGAIGDVATVQSDFYIGAHFDGFRATMSHVLLLDMAIHTFDAARYIAGADGVDVYAHDWNPKGSWYDHGASAACIFNMTNDITYLYNGSWCTEGCNTTWNCSWRITGTRGTVLWDGNKSFRAETVKRAGGFISEMDPVDVPVAPLPEDREGQAGLIHDFVEAIKGGPEPMTMGRDNIKSLAMVIAAVESCETGRRVRVEAGSR